MTEDCFWRDVAGVIVLGESEASLVGLPAHSPFFSPAGGSGSRSASGWETIKFRALARALCDMPPMGAVGGSFKLSPPQDVRRDEGRELAVPRRLQ